MKGNVFTIVGVTQVGPTSVEDHGWQCLKHVLLAGWEVLGFPVE